MTDIDKALIIPPNAADIDLDSTKLTRIYLSNLRYALTIFTVLDTF